MIRFMVPFKGPWKNREHRVGCRAEGARILVFDPSPDPSARDAVLEAWKVVGGPLLCMCIYTPRDRERERERDRAYVQKLECVLFECVRTGEKVPEHPPGAPSALPKGPWEVRQPPQHIGPKAQLPGSFGSFSRSFPFTSKSCVFWRHIVV